MIGTRREFPVDALTTIAHSDEISTRVQAVAYKLGIPFSRTASLAFALLETIVDLQLFTREDGAITLIIKQGGVESTIWIRSRETERAEKA